MRYDDLRAMFIDCTLGTGLTRYTMVPDERSLVNCVSGSPWLWGNCVSADTG
jgi:hypothetical protein